MMNGAVNQLVAWTGFILGVVVLITAAHFCCDRLTQRWRAPRSATMNVQLNIWMIPLIIAFIAAWKMSQWVESDVAGWIASTAILSAAMGTAYGQGLADGQRSSRTEPKDG